MVSFHVIKSNNKEMDYKKSYPCQRWALFTIAMVELIYCIGMVFLQFLAIVEELEERGKHENISKGEMGSVKCLSEGMVTAFVVIEGLFNLTGVVGAYHENYCLVIT